mgnify:CR=1 FL=1
MPENDSSTFDKTIAILGTGNIGQAIAEGIVNSGKYKPEQLILTRRNTYALKSLKEQGYQVQSDNRDAVRSAKTVIIAVQPQQLQNLLAEIRADLDPERHIIISTITAVSINEILKHTGKELPVIRAMPNTAIAIGQSMTCIAAHEGFDDAVEETVELFNLLGEAIVISENQMTPATALVACGIAFFLRSIRAASQGGIEIGFHADEALHMAAQTAKGAASLLLQNRNHPEDEIDKVTTPRGCTIGGLNFMEHEGFSSAMIKGIVTSANLAAGLYDDNEE